MPRLRRVNPNGPGLYRIRCGEGFRYVDAAGSPVTDQAVLQRIEALVLPPAWEDVWICRTSTGHIQATGMDVAGRRQYRYHDHWRATRDMAKHERILDFATLLPRLREQICQDLRAEGLGRQKVLSCAVRLLDLGFFRVGSEQYRSSFGLATIRKEHVTVSRAGLVTFDYPAKSGQHRVQSVAEPEVCAIISALKRRRTGGDELLAYQDRGRWVDVRSGEVNGHLQELTGFACSAKDFRTWNATVLAAVGLAVQQDAGTVTARRRAVSRVLQEVAHYLGNTPGVCRSSYVDPRVLDLFDSGTTIRPDLQRLGEDAAPGTPATQGRVEAAVLRLLRASAAAAAA